MVLLLAVVTLGVSTALIGRAYRAESNQRRVAEEKAAETDAVCVGSAMQSSNGLALPARYRR